MFTSVRIILRAARQWSANHDSRLGAALAYYALFSIAPLMVIAVLIAGAAFGADAAQGQIAEHLDDLVGPDVAATIQALVENASQRRGAWAPAVSIGLSVVGALGMFLHIRGSLNTIWSLDPPRGSNLLGILWDYTLALAMVLCCGVLLLGSLAASMLVRIFRPTLEEWIPALPWNWVELGLSFVYLTVLFASIYRILSGARIRWRYVLYGSLIAAVLFTLGKTLLGYYFLYTSTASVYGAAGSLVAFLIWVYYSAQILFFGAELIQARRTREEWLPSASTSASA